LKAFLKFDGDFRRVGSLHNMLLVEAVDRGVEFVQVPVF
jgi:hypothetical protein